MKSLEENPWLSAKDVIKDEEIVKGKVTTVRDFGAFVEIYPLVEGLLNKYQIADYQNNTNKTINEGDEIEVKIAKFDPDNQKIDLEIL